MKCKNCETESLKCKFMCENCRVEEVELFVGLCENCMREIEETEWDNRKYCGDE